MLDDDDDDFGIPSFERIEWKGVPAAEKKRLITLYNEAGLANRIFFVAAANAIQANRDLEKALSDQMRVSRKARVPSEQTDALEYYRAATEAWASSVEDFTRNPF